MPDISSVCITASGMATALAPNLPDSCAAARAGITRMRALDIVDLSECAALGQDPVAGCTARYIGTGFAGSAKVLLLGKAALADLESRISLSDGMRRTGIFVNVSDRYYEDSNFGARPEMNPRLPSAVWADRCKQLIPDLLRMCNLESIPQNHHLYAGGHTGFVQAMTEAASSLRNGYLDRCLVGGIDSCIDPRFLSAAAAKGVLKTSENPVGFIAGEGAAFVVLERAAEGRMRKGDAAGFLMGASYVAQGRDRLSDDAPDGVALARAIDQALRASGSSGERVAWIMGDLNGDEYRARDWGNALPRLRAKHNLADVPLGIPALAFGETGAASGPLGLCLGIAGQQRAWIPPGPVVAWLSSDKGSRAALCFASTGGAYRG